MNKSKIEWCDYTINPVKGLCPVACPYCYARRMYKRFKWNQKVRFDNHQWAIDKHKIAILQKPSKIFVGSTIDLFHKDIEKYVPDILDFVQAYQAHTFIFLTKRPENLIKFSPFPKNCWVGVSATDDKMFTYAWQGLKDVQSTVKFVSFEPLLSWDMSKDDVEFTLKTAGINWVIIGQQTPLSAKTLPRVDKITQIMTVCDKLSIPIFLKNNLNVLLPFRQHYKDDYHFKCWQLRQEYPNVRRV